MRRELTKHIVADPEIWHGEPTFNGTRIRVVDVLELLSLGMDWDEVVRQYSGKFPREAVGEALLLSSAFFARHSEEIDVDLLAA